MPNVHAPAWALTPLESVKSPVSPVAVGAISPPCASRGVADRASAAAQAPNLLFTMFSLPPTVFRVSRRFRKRCLFYNGTTDEVPSDARESHLSCLLSRSQQVPGLGPYTARRQSRNSSRKWKLHDAMGLTPRCRRALAWGEREKTT